MLQRGPFEDSTKKKENAVKRLVLVDTAALIYRAYFAYPSDLANKEGVSTNAIYGFILMILRIIEQYTPSNLVFALESTIKLKRSEIYPEYKSTRKKTDESLVEQIKIIEGIISQLGLISKRIDGYEADDIIGSLGRIGFNEFDEILVVSGDRDLLQLINEKTKVLLPGSSFAKLNVFGYEEFEKKYGLPVDKYVFYKALVGDSSDNIKGLSGVGPKTAIKIVNSFSSFYQMFSNLDLISHKYAELIVSNRENLELDYKLSEVVCDLNIEINWDDALVSKFILDELKNVFIQYDFSSLLKKFDKLSEFFSKEYGLAALKEKSGSERGGLFDIPTSSNSVTEYKLEYKIVDNLEI